MTRERNPAFEWRDQFGRAGYRGAVLAVGTWIGNHWNGDNRHPLAPVDLLMRELGYSRRSVTLALATLRRDGWLSQINRGGRRGTSAWVSRYRLTVPVTEDPNVQSPASQCAKDCTLVDQTGLDQTNPPVAPLVAHQPVVEPDPERLKRKWAGCALATMSGCSHCEPNDGCVAAMRKAGLLT